MSELLSGVGGRLVGASVLLALSALLVQGLVWLLRPSSSRVQQLAWFFVLVQGAVLFHLPIQVAWREPSEPPIAAGDALPSSARLQVAEPGEGYAPLQSIIESRGDKETQGAMRGLSALAADSGRQAATATRSASYMGLNGHLDPARCVAWIWFAGVLGMPALWGLAYFCFLRRVSGSYPLEPDWADEWQSLLAERGIRRRVELQVTDRTGPVLCWTPEGYRVYVPRQLWAGLSAGQRRAILRHELAHFERGDLWLGMLARLLALPHWFNPFAWWAARRFAECSEWVCDEAAAGDQPRQAVEYAKALLQLGCAPSPVLCYARAAQGSPLAARVRRLLTSQLRKDSTMKKLLLLAFAVGLVAFNLIRIELTAKEPSADARAAAMTNQDRSSQEANAGLQDSQAGPVNVRIDLEPGSVPAGAKMRFGAAPMQNREGVVGGGFLDGGRTLACVTYGGECRLWDVASGRFLRAYRAPQWRTSTADVAFSPEGNKMAWISSWGEVGLWDLSAGKSLFQNPGYGVRSGHIGFSYGVAFAADGKTFATAGIQDGEVHVWDAANGNVLRRFATVQGRTMCHAVAISPDGKFLASGLRMTNSGERRSGWIYLWDLQSGKELWVIKEAHGDEVTSLVFTPDGKRLISGGVKTDWREGSGTMVSQIRIWDVATSKRLEELTGETGQVWVAISPDGKSLASTHHQQTRIWDLASAKPVHSLTGNASSFPMDQKAVFSPDGTVLATFNHTGFARLWDVSTGKALREQPDVFARAIDRLAFSGDGKHLLAASETGSRARLWDAATGKLLARTAYGRDVIALSDDGQTAATARYRWESEKRTMTGLLRTWDAMTGTMRQEIGVRDPITAARFSFDGKLLAAATYDLRGADSGSPFSRNEPIDNSPTRNATIHLFHPATGEETGVLSTGGTGKILAMAFSADNQSLWCAAEDMTLRRWDVATTREQAGLKIAGYVEKDRNAFQGECPLSVVFSRDGTTAATSYLGDNQLFVWDLAAGKRTTVIRIPIAPGRGLPMRTFLALSPDGRRLAWASIPPYDNSVHLCETSTGAETRQFLCRDAATRSLTFSPDGKTLVSGMDDGTAVAWDLSEGR